MPQGSLTDIARLLVVLPSWVGDVVMATPMLRALRRSLPGAHLAGLMRRGVEPVLDPCNFLDERIVLPSRKVFPGARRLRGGRFDAALILPNSFRSAAMVRLARIPQRIGYARDGRGRLLTHTRQPLRDGDRYTPISTIDYYLDLAQRVGVDAADRTMHLDVHPDDPAQADELIRRAAPDDSGGGPLVMLNPGGSYGAAKLWPAARFAAVADALIDAHGARVLVNGAPAERAILDAVHDAARHPLVDLPARGMNLRLLKAVVQRCDLMITNDTGPRHFAAALGTPVVTIFGPTDPRWAEVDFPAERQLRVDVFCGPCQLKTCPLDHRCMTRVTVDRVTDAARELLHQAVQPGHASSC